jgi:hypothetical protein
VPTERVDIAAATIRLTGVRLIQAEHSLGSHVSKFWILCRTCGLETQIRHDTGAMTVVQSTPG